MEDSSLAIQIQRLLAAIQTSGYAVLPHSTDALLSSIVEVAARLFGAAAASIALLDEEEGMLEFVVSYGAGNEEVVGMRMPMDRGIAGHVVMTGQPIAVSDVRRDPRFNRAFAESTTYVPNSILATPLLSGDRIIGVMEVLDKIDAASFNIQELELLGMFAHQAAIAIHQSQQVEHLGDALVLGLQRIANEGGQIGEGIPLSDMQDVFTVAPSATLLSLADLFNEISTLGEAEQQLCLSTLTTFARYARNRRRMGL